MPADLMNRVRSPRALQHAAAPSRSEQRRRLGRLGAWVGVGCAALAAASGCTSEDAGSGDGAVTQSSGTSTTDSSSTATNTAQSQDGSQSSMTSSNGTGTTTPAQTGTNTADDMGTAGSTSPTQSTSAPPDGSATTTSTGSAPQGSGGSGGSGGMVGTGDDDDPPVGGDGGAGGGETVVEADGGSGMETPDGPSTCPYEPPELPETFPDGWTNGDVTVFNDNGGWTWYNDERVVVDVEAGKIVVSSAASNAQNQTATRNIDAVIHDLATGTNDKMELGTLSYSDDHNNGGIVITAPGEYFVAWAHHNVDCNTYWRNYTDGAWGGQVTHTWGKGCPWPGPNGSTSEVTYNNPWKLSSEGRIYNFIRSVETSPYFMLSEDNGQTWDYGGRLTSSPQQGYNAGYYKYWGNGVDRIDFFATEAHPRDANTSIYHGYVQGGKVYDSFDQEVDDNVLDDNARGITSYTRIFEAGSALDGVTMRRLWNFDVARYEDGTIGVLWQGRENECPDKNNCNPGHHVAYSRFDGTQWTSTYLVRGGRTLYRNKSDWWEEDYLGGAALDPDDPHVIYVSTNIDPRDNSTEYPVNEIWKGVSCDDGASFQWEPVTMNSPNENLRPAVPKWDAQNTALLWFRGNYQTAQMYSAQVVGILTRE